MTTLAPARVAEAMASALSAIGELVKGAVVTEEQAGRLVEYLLPEEVDDSS